MKLPMMQDFSSKGFARMNLKLSPTQILELYNQFDVVCDIVETKYEAEVSALDELIEKFIVHSDTNLANDTLKFKYINIDSEKWRVKFPAQQKFNIFSYQYLDGLYEYIHKSKVEIDCEVVDFLKNIHYFHSIIKRELSELIDAIAKQIPCKTLLKIWRHVAIDGNQFLLPPHCDRSIFTIVLNTKSSSDECLRIYPHGSTFEQLKTPYQPIESDFPIIFPGMYAKSQFDLEPSVHGVVAPMGKSNPLKRYSIVLFIAPEEG